MSSKLPGFKQKGPYLWNCRCILCGDSSTKKNKIRGYFYAQKQNLYYKCHNCGASLHFGTFLKGQDQVLYDAYVFERYAKGEGGRANAHAKPDEELFGSLGLSPELVLTPKEWVDDKLEGVCQRLDTLPDDHEAVQYCLNRSIPREQFFRLFAIPHTKDIVKLAPQYAESLTTEEPRLVIPFHKENGKIVGVSLRAIRGESKRYIMVRFEEEVAFVFGLNLLNTSLPIVVLEGQFDSLFIPNSIACGGTSFGKVETFGLPKEKVTIVFDNQPRNAEVMKIMNKYIDLGYAVCIWPSDIGQKDVNEMVIAGLDAHNIILENTFQGLMAMAKFSEWRKI